MDVWSSGRAADLAGLVARALPDEELSLDEVLACCWEDPEPGDPGAGVVLGTPGGTGAVAVVVREPAAHDDASTPRRAFLKLVVVAPDQQHRGLGHRLMAAAEAWAWEHGAAELRIEGTAPLYLWPGADVRWTAMRALATSRGYEPVGEAVNLTIPTATRPPVPDGVTIRRVLQDDDVGALFELLGREFPEYVAEARRAVESGCCHLALDLRSTAGTDREAASGGRPVGFACHSVSRAGWIGPLGTDPADRSAGVGRALLGQVCRDLMIAEYVDAEICWAGPIGFYEQNGARPSRRFDRYRLARPAR